MTLILVLLGLRNHLALNEALVVHAALYLEVGSACAVEHLLLALLELLLLAGCLKFGKLLVEGVGSVDPCQHNTQQDDTQVGCGSGQAAQADNHELLDEGTTRLAERVADHINGCLALGLDLLIQGDVCHLLAL